MDVPTAMRGGIRTLRAKCEVLISGGTGLTRPVMNAPNAQSPWLMPRLGPDVLVLSANACLHHRHVPCWRCRYCIYACRA